MTSETEYQSPIHWRPRAVTIQGNGIRLRLGGGDNPPPVIQSMLDTANEDLEGSWRQINDLVAAGCSFIRISVPSRSSLNQSEELISRVERENLPCVLSADIHFAPQLAFDCLDAFHKVRVNPGNFVEKNQGRSGMLGVDQIQAIQEKIQDRFGAVVDKAARLGRALRVGVNHGSLADRMVQLYGDTPRGMVESALEYLNIAWQKDFTDVVVSLKASNVVQMLEANLLYVREAMKRDRAAPLHLGITEAGAGREARLKSAMGIGFLLGQGVGETIRVSLAESPVAEISVGQEIIRAADVWRKEKAADFYGQFPRFVLTEADPPPEHGGLSNLYKDVSLLRPRELAPPDLPPEPGQPDGLATRDLPPELAPKIPGPGKGPELVFVSAAGEVGKLTADSEEELSIQAGFLLLNQEPKDLVVRDEAEQERAGLFLQAARIRSFVTEFIACPGCARTLFDLQTVTDRIKNAFYGIPGLKIAVMGCIVNGPGEMADADYGYVGAGTQRIDLYRGREVVRKGIPPEKALLELADLIDSEHPDFGLRETAADRPGLEELVT